MSFTAAVATGMEAVTDLERLLRGARARGALHWVATPGQAVAWAARHRWVTSHDDGDVLVVLDGQLHNLPMSGRPQAALLHDRYQDTRDHLGQGLLGDFVVIVLDRTRGSLLVCRDPVGVRPWYQATSGRRHSGATETATLCALPWVDVDVDDRVALAYLAGVSESRGPTLHRGVVSLAPGATWRSVAGSTDTWAHHRWEIRPEPNVTWDEAIHRCRTVLDEAVRCRVTAAGSATSELSGGLDSSSVVGTAVQLGFEDVTVGRLLFSGDRADERTYSDAVIRHWGIRSVSAEPWIPTEDEAWELTSVLRRPVPDPNFTMFAALHRRLLARGRPCALTGLGGDDAFVARSHRSRVLSALQQRRFGVLTPVARADLRHPREGWRRTVRPVLGALLHRARRRPPRYISDYAAESSGLTARLAEPVERLTGIRAVDERAGGLTSGYVASIMETAAVVNDLTGWRESHPFFDPRLITATYGLDPWFSVRGGHNRALEVAAYADRLPREVRERRGKAEFSEVAWSSSIAHESIYPRLLNGPLRERGWLDPVGFEDVLEGARNRRPTAAGPLARALSLDRWLRQRAT